MISSLKATFLMVATFRATLSAALLPGAASEDREITFKEANRGTFSLDATTSPALEAGVPISLTMTTGVPVSVDLTSAPQPGGESNIDLTGKRLLGMIMLTGSANAGTIEIAPADANGYDLWQTAAGVRLPKKSRLQILDEVASRPAVAASGARYIEFDGTTGDTIEGVLFFGT